MKNKQEIIGLITNIALVVLLLCFIVAGLNIVGIYSLPSPIEKLLGTFEGGENPTSDDDIAAYSDSNFNEEARHLEPVVLDYKDAKSVLGSLSARDNYLQKVRVTNIYGGLRRDEIFNITRKSGFYTIVVCDKNGNVLKKVSQQENNILISENYDENQEPLAVNRGNFNVNEECGFVLTAEEFLESGYNLSQADFRQFNKDDGAYLSVVFDTIYNGRTLSHKYVFSLDFGVAVEAYSYENEEIVYEMITESISVLE